MQLHRQRIFAEWQTRLYDGGIGRGRVVRHTGHAYTTLKGDAINSALLPAVDRR